MLSVTASSYSEQTRYSIGVGGIVTLAGKPYKVQVYLNENQEVRPGDILNGSFRMRLTTPDGIRDSSYERGNGVYLIASQKGDVEILHREELPFWCYPAVFSQQVKDALVSCFPEDTVSFAKALLLGDTEELTYEEDTALKISGIRHVAAVSGLHVSILYGLIAVLFRFHRFLTPLASIPAMLLFAAVTGFTPSVTRACLMTGLMSVGTALLEEYDGLTGLAFAALVMMMTNPCVPDSVSFQLSVTSVIGILLFAAPISQWIISRFPKVKSKSKLGGIIRWIAGSAAVSVSASLATTPLSAWYFGAVSLIGVLTNLLTLWCITFIFCGTGIVGVFAKLLPAVCSALAAGVSWLIRFVLWTAKQLAHFSFAAVYTQSPYIVMWLVSCYILLLLWFLRRQKGKLLLACAGCALAAAISASVFLPRLDDVRLHVLDVGEGQCILLQSRGQSFLIDCGGDSDDTAANTAAQVLLSQGIDRLDGIVFTHYDRDHSGALENLLTRISADRLYLPVMDDGGFLERTSVDLSSACYIAEDTVLPFGCGQLTLIAPDTLKTVNENCMCILFESEKCDILVTGDRSRSGEKRLLKSRELPDVDILIAGHHGSKNSTSYELLDAVKPETVIFSVGRNNNYGHPAQEVLDRLAEYHCTVYRTDLQGSVLVRRDAWQRNRLRMEASRS